MALSSSRRECTESWSGSQGPIFVIGSGKRSRGGVMRTVGIAGWVVIVGAFLGWKGFALAYSRRGPRWREIFGTARRPLPGRRTVFGGRLGFGVDLSVGDCGVVLLAGG